MTGAGDAAPPRPAATAELARALKAFPTLLRIGVAEVVAYLKNYGTAEVEDLTVIEEDVEFLLPKELITIESASKSVATSAR